MSVFTLLVVIAILFAIFSMIFSNYPLLPVAVLLLGIALLVGGGARIG